MQSLRNIQYGGNQFANSVKSYSFDLNENDKLLATFGRDPKNKLLTSLELDFDHSMNFFDYQRVYPRTGSLIKSVRLQKLKWQEN